MEIQLNAGKEKIIFNYLMKYMLYYSHLLNEMHKNLDNELEDIILRVITIVIDL